MSSVTLKAALEQLRSEKIKERQDGFSLLRTVFSHESMILQTDGAGDGLAWIVIYQTVFGAVAKEKDAFVKKESSQAILRRLSDAASAVRWLIERSVERMNTKVVKDVITHLRKFVIYKGELFTPVALQYIKAIRCILSFPPHLEHLAEESWVTLLEMSLNVVLGEPVRKNLEDTEGVASETGEGDVAADMDMEFSVEDDEDGMPSPSRPSSSRKRKLPTASRAHRTPIAGSPAPRSHSVTQEQVEFMSILVLLLQSSSAHLLAPTHRYLPAALLNRFTRFLRRYPGDSSLHHDYLQALSAALSHVALNDHGTVTKFARESWDSLIGLWGTKNQRMKQDLVIVLQALFPYYTADPVNEDIFSRADYGYGVTKLWHRLSGEAESRWGVDGLSLDRLRLEVAQPDSRGDGKDAFVASTFRYGWHFDASQALAWAILQLQADCTAKLYCLAESAHALELSGSRSIGKRLKLENPIKILLDLISQQSVSAIRSYHLQSLLFFIDKHWSILHDELQHQVISVLLQFVSFEDGSVQSWTFLCLAAIAQSVGDAARSRIIPATRGQEEATRPALWNPIWAHAMRRTNVAIVSRAACHAAFTLLLYAKELLTSQRVLAEVETLGKDLDVQGPAFPCDSVCAFLDLILRVASQDVRLYRMQMEEKVLTWFLDTWNVQSAAKTKMPLLTVADVLLLLESTCSLQKRSSLVCGRPLPVTPVVQATIDHCHTTVIRDFTLYAHLPRITRSCAKPSNSTVNQTASESVHDLAQPRSRERRVSAFLMKVTEELCAVWETSKDTSGFLTAERVRSYLDAAFTALSFEAVLVLNGTRSTRRAIQAACRLFQAVAPQISDKRWSSEERTLVLGSLHPLVLAQEDLYEIPWQTLVPPGEDTGVRRETVKYINREAGSGQDQGSSVRREVQRIVFRSADVQDAFGGLLILLRQTLQLVSGASLDAGIEAQAMTIDKEDDFGHVRTVQDVSKSADASQKSAAFLDPTSIDICMKTLAIIPVLQSTSGEPNRDKELANAVLNADDSQFLSMVSPYLSLVEAGILTLSVLALRALSERLAQLWKQYHYARNDHLQGLSLQFLHSTMHMWIRSDTPFNDAHDSVWQLWTRLAPRLASGKISSPKVRDAVVRFLDSCLAEDPREDFWMSYVSEQDDEENLTGGNTLEAEVSNDNLSVILPAAILPRLGADPDIRVRFRAATAISRLFVRARILEQDPLKLYKDVRPHWSTEQTEYERMLTRILSLTNIMIVSSATRRGAYWHLLEICLFAPGYAKHVEVALTGVTNRLGLCCLSDLFEHYASQIATSICHADQDLLNFPPYVLGFGERRQCAEAAFHAFTPANLLNNFRERGSRLFRNHCNAVHKSVAEGLADCFSEIVGYQIVISIGFCIENPTHTPSDLEMVLRGMMENLGDGQTFDGHLRQNADAILATILRTICDQDFSRDGPIFTGLRKAGFGEDSIHELGELFQYRTHDGFGFHTPNHPAYSTEAVLKSIEWFTALVPETDTPAITYHVLHQLFADMQRCPFINEQMRLLNGMCVWVAIRRRHFEDHTLFRTIMNMATTILSQPDMARPAQSILQWGHNIYRRSKEHDSRLPDLLVQVSWLAQEYCSDPSDPLLNILGQDLARWAEATIQDLAGRKSLRPQLIRVLAAWPSDGSPALEPLRKSLNRRDMSDILRDHRAMAKKFRLVRRLHELASDHQEPDDHFGISDFWHLKECMPSPASLRDGDIDAFAALLLLNDGHIRSPEHTAADVTTQTLRVRHYRSMASDENAAQRAVVVSLLEILDTTSAAEAHAAYSTLRLLMSVYDPDSGAKGSSSFDYAGDLRYLKAHPIALVKTVSGSLPRALASGELLEASMQFSDWISNITIYLCYTLAESQLFYAGLVSIIRSNTTFAQDVLPVLVHTALHSERSIHSPSHEETLRTALSKHFTAILTHQDADVLCLRAIVDVVLHLRHFQPTGSRDALAYDQWLQNDYRLLARTAIKCGAYTTPFLFLQLADDHDPEEGTIAENAEDVLFDMYSRIDEPDGFYGIRTSNPTDFLINRLHHEKQWETAFRYHGAALSARPLDAMHGQGMVQSLRAFGFDRLAMTALADPCSRSHSDGDDTDTAMMYQLGWRTGTWDLPDCSNGPYPGVSLYMSLRAVYRERDQSTVDAIVRAGFLQELTHLRNTGNEDLTGIRRITQNLMCLYQIRQWRHQSSQHEEGHVPARVAFTAIGNLMDFDDTEAIMATRISLIRAQRQKEERNQIGDLASPLSRSLMNSEREYLLGLSEAARVAFRPQTALNRVTQAQALGGQAISEVSQEYANVLWLMKEPRLAASLLKNILSDRCVGLSASSYTERSRKAMLLSCLGTWSAQASLEKPDLIVEQYYHPATEILKDDEFASTLQEHASVFHQYAIFADHQYHSIVNSPDALRWRIYVDRKTEEIKLRRERLQKAQVGTHQQRVLAIALQKAQQELDQDHARFKDHMDARDRFLVLAVTNYAQCLATSDSYDNEAIIRLCSLWLANFDIADTRVDFSAAVQQVPSHKFVFLAHQLAARLSKSPSSQPTSNQQLLHALLLRMCREHPFHSLYQVFCLISEQDSISAGSRRQSGRATNQSSQAERVAAALQLFDQLRNDPAVQGRLRDVESVCRASLQWAKYPIKNQNLKSGGRYHVPEDLAITKIRNLRVPVITSLAPVDPSCQYGDCVWISHFESAYTVAGGVNLPKITNCVGEDGHQYKQLYKGEGGDDLRQDAVMEQVFELVNIVLRRDQQTRRRGLAVRGYKVIPLASQAGVLEFVKDTTSLNAWLTAAHPRYRPQDMLPKEGFDELRKNHCTDRDRMLQIFLRVRQRFKPVMRHYFTERHKDPLAWFTMRLKYSRSVATTSIVGHILGLGDRHTSNILMDNLTGEVVHIDLGIAFEQGKALGVPERVPFRLTADMVDGMGTSGTQGVFQRCAEETLRVLRDESEVMLTVLEVFKYDPLHSWAASEVKLKRAQGSPHDTALTGDAVRWVIGIDMTSGTADEAADRALSTVRRKLDKTLSVEFTINELVAEATDPGNLALMFFGWGPHL